MNYTKPSLLHYRFAQAASRIVSSLIFHVKILRNEIREKKGPYVVICNHQAALDFVNLIGVSRRPMSFVISNSFYNTLPIKGYLEKMGVIPKQQFQTTVHDLKRIKAVIDHGEPVVIYPAGLMCEDGLSTPIPSATYKFLKWLNADVYVARTYGSYFVMPKWTSGFRPGRTYLDIYQLFSKEELNHTDLETITEKVNHALHFDAYREQENNKVKYQNCSNISGLENVLYQCPHCGSEFTMEVAGTDTICCTHCSYSETSDEYGFLHSNGIGQEIRYVSDWSKYIYNDLVSRIQNGEDGTLRASTKIQMIDYSKNKFIDVGEGILTLTESGFSIDGTIHSEDVSIAVSIAGLPTLPFGPGKYLEIQSGNKIYRCVLDDGRLVMKFINMVKIYHTLNKPVRAAAK